MKSAMTAGTTESKSGDYVMDLQCTTTETGKTCEGSVEATKQQIANSVSKTVHSSTSDSGSFWLV